MINVYYADVSPLNNEAIFNAAINSILPHRKKKAEALKIRSAQNLSVGASLVMDAAFKNCGYSTNELTFDTQVGGKPCVKGENLCFSISHSGTIAMCAVAPWSIGIDVEEIGECNMGICKRFFGKNEYNIVAGAKNNAERNTLFFRIWTLKESYVKMTGKGLGGFCDFEVSLGENPHINELGTESYLRELEIPGYKIAICSEVDTPVNLERINIIKPFV